MSKFNQSGSYVCPVFATSGKCGEQDALEVMEQFKDFYETKLSEIDVQGGGDCLEVRVPRFFSIFRNFRRIGGCVGVLDTLNGTSALYNFGSNFKFTAQTENPEAMD
jgi:hypothetical protein